MRVRKQDKELPEGAEAENTTDNGEQLPLPDATTVPSFSPVEVESTTAIHETQPPYQDYGSTSGSSGTSEGSSSTRHEQAIVAREATTSSSKTNRGEPEVQPPRQHEHGGKTAGSVVMVDDVALSAHSDHADENASITANYKLGKRKHRSIILSSEDEAPSQPKKARNHVSKSVLHDTAGPAPNNKVQKPVRRRKKARSVIPRALRKPKPNNTVKFHSQSTNKSHSNSESKRLIESNTHSKDISVAEKVAKSHTIRNNGAFSEAHTGTNPSPHKLRGISPEIPLQSNSSAFLQNGNSAYASSDTESSSDTYKPSNRMPPAYDSESSQTDDLSESYSEEDWKPARLKRKKSMRQKAMKAAGLIIDDILKIRRKQSSRTVIYDCIGSPKVKKGVHSPKRRLSLITRDAPKAERWSGHSTRKSLTLSTDFFGSPGTIQARRESTSETLMQVNLGDSNEGEPLVRKTDLSSTDSSTDEQSSSAVDDDSGGMSRAVSRATWLKELPKRQLTVQLDKEVRIRGKYDSHHIQSPKPSSEAGDLKSSEESVLENGAKHKHNIAQRMLSQQSGEPSVDPLVFASFDDDDKDKDSHTSSNKAKDSSKQLTIPSSDEDLEDAIVDILGVDSVDEDNTNGTGTRANHDGLKQNFTRIRLTSADFTAGDSPTPGLEEGTSGNSSEDETKKSSKQESGRVSDDDMQEPIDVLGVDDTTSNIEDKGSSERDEAKLNLAQTLKPTLIKPTNADLTTESSLPQEGGEEGAVENIKDGESGSTKELGGRRNSEQTLPRILTGKEIHDLLAAVSSKNISVETVLSKNDSSEQISKPVLTKKRRAINLQNVRVVLDALPVSRSPIGKAAVIVNCEDIKSRRNKEGTMRKVRAGARSDTRGHGVPKGESKIAKGTKAKQSSKPPSRRKKVAKQMEDDADDIVVKDLVEANNEDYRVKLKLISKKQIPAEKKHGTKPTRFKPLSGPLGIASSTEDDDNVGKVKKARKTRTVQHTSEKKTAGRKLTTKQVVKEGEGSGMEIDALQAVASKGSVSEKPMEIGKDIMTQLSSQSHHSKTIGEASSECINTTTPWARSLEEHNYSKADPKATTVSQNQEEHHRKAVAEASWNTVVTNPITHHQPHNVEEHNYSKTIPPPTSLSQNLEGRHDDRTVGEASSKSVVANPTNDLSENRTEQQSTTNPTIGSLLSQILQSMTRGEMSFISAGTDSTSHEPHSLEASSTVLTGPSQNHPTSSEFPMTNVTATQASQDQRELQSETNPTTTSSLEERHSKTVGEVSSKSAEATNSTTTQMSQNQTSLAANPTTAHLSPQIQTEHHSNTIGNATRGIATVSSDSGSGGGSSSRNTVVDSLAAVGGASVTMTTSRSTSTAEDQSMGSNVQPKKKRTTLLNRTKASSGFQLSVVEEKKVHVCDNVIV